MQRGSAAQRSLFGGGTASASFAFASVERTVLEPGAWFDLARGWASGHEQLFDELERTVEWRAEDRVMYEKRVEVPRLVARLPAETRPSVVEAMRVTLSDRYGEDFVHVTAAYYRDGRDSVAWHGDYVARELPGDTVMATVSVGSPRKFLLRPKGGGPSLAVTLGWGDLLVMGGSIQRTYDHAIPKVAKASPRIAIMFRPAWG